MAKNIGENIRQNLTGKYRQNFLNHAKQSAQHMHLKLLWKK